MAKRERASIQPERLGNALRGRDVLIPGGPAVLPASSEAALEEPPAKIQENLESTKVVPISSSPEREPVTIRLSKLTIRRLARKKMELLEELDLRVSQSDLVEAAIWSFLEHPQEIEPILERLHSGRLFKSA
jgi:hypothetical protein